MKGWWWRTWLGSGGLRARTEWTQCSRIGEINKGRQLSAVCPDPQTCEGSTTRLKHEKIKGILVALLCVYEKSRKVYFCFTDSVLRRSLVC